MPNLPEPTFGTQLIGQTEKALNAILNQLLAGTDVTESDWVVLNLTAMTNGTSSEDLNLRVAGTLKIDIDVAGDTVGALLDRGLLDATDDRVVLSNDGTTLLTDVRSRVVELTGRLWGDLDPADLQTAARVLALVLSRANDELAALTGAR
jgi:hypothetical protein